MTSSAASSSSSSSFSSGSSAPSTAAWLAEMKAVSRAWEEWEARIIADFPSETMEHIFDLHTHSMNIYNGFGHLSRPPSGALAADRQSGGAIMREVQRGLPPAKRVMVLQKDQHLLRLYMDSTRAERMRGVAAQQKERKKGAKRAAAESNVTVATASKKPRTATDNGKKQSKMKIDNHSSSVSQKQGRKKASYEVGLSCCCCCCGGGCSARALAVHSHSPSLCSG